MVADTSSPILLLLDEIGSFIVAEILVPLLRVLASFALGPCAAALVASPNANIPAIHAVLIFSSAQPWLRTIRVIWSGTPRLGGRSRPYVAYPQRNPRAQG